MNGGVVEAVRTQQIQIGGRHLLLAMGELDRMGAEDAIRLGHRGGAPIAHQRVDKSIGGFAALKLIGDLSTEVVGVCLRSVGAV